MSIILINDPASVSDLASLIDRVRHGDEVVFKEGDCAIAVMQSPAPPRRTIAECIALCPADSPPVDDDFSGDIAQAVAWHREPPTSSAWD